MKLYFNKLLSIKLISLINSRTSTPDFSLSLQCVCQGAFSSVLVSIPLLIRV